MALCKFSNCEILEVNFIVGCDVALADRKSFFFCLLFNIFNLVVDNVF